MKKKVYLFFLLLLTMLMGCGKGEEKKGSENVLRVAKDVELATMDTTTATDGTSFEIITTTKEGLYNVDANGVPYPGAAESYEMSEDGLTYTFHLRENGKWSNGTPVTAKDFVFGWKREVDPKTAAVYSFILETAGVKNAGKVMKGEVPVEDLGITAVDDFTLKVELERPTPFFLSLTAFCPFFPVNEEFFNEQGDQYALEPENLLANGPYKLVDWKKGYGFKVERNENYYNADKVKLDGIDFRVIKDNQTAALKFDSGELDVVKLSAELVDKYKDNEAFQKVGTGFMWYTAFNNQVGDLKNENLRKAFVQAVDKSYITDGILGDGSEVADFIVPKNFSTGPDGKDFREGTPGYLPYNKEEALKSWNLAKEELGKGEVEIELLFEDFETVKKMAEYMQSQLMENLPGLKVTLKAQPKKNRLSLMQSGNYEVALTRWGPDYGDPQTYLEIFTTGQTFNYPNYSNPEFDELLNKISKGEYTLDPKKRWEGMKQAEKILLEEAGIGPLYQRGYAFLIRKGVTGVDSHASGTPFTYTNAAVVR